MFELMLQRSGVFAIEHREYLLVASTAERTPDKLKSFCPEANEEGHLPHEHLLGLFSMCLLSSQSTLSDHPCA